MFLGKLRETWSRLGKKPVNLEVIQNDVEKKLQVGIEHSIKVYSFKKFAKMVKQFVISNDVNGNEIVTSEGVVYTKKANVICNPYTNTYPGVNRTLEVRKGSYSFYWVAAVNGNKAEVIAVQM